MKCPRCGFVQSAAQQTCRYCGSKLSPSVLIPFPKVRGASATDQASTPEVPEWRVELRERVRAIRARKGLQVNPSPGQPAPSVEAPAPARTIHTDSATPQSRRSVDGREQGVAAREQAPATVKKPLVGDPREGIPSGRPARSSSIPSPDTPSERRSDRVERPALHGSLPATARVEPRRDLEPVPSEKDSVAPAAVSTKGTPPAPLAPEAKSTPAASARPIQARALPEEDLLEEIALESPASAAADAVPPSLAEKAADVTGEIPALSREVADPVGPAGFFRRLYAGLVDVGIIAFACLPFVSCVELAQGNLTDWRVLALLGIAAALVGVIYLSLLLTMGGRTVGMAAAGLLVLDARTMDLPSFFQVVLRMVGLLLGIAPFGIGLLWAVIDRERRTFSDLLSRTVVRRVSESLYESQQIRAPWLYRPGRR